MILTNGRYRGHLYRALNPVYARMPLSGRGAEQYGGRFNPKGTPSLYTALSPVTALREANQVGELQPTTLVSYRADLGPIFDCRDAAALTSYKMQPDQLADPAWRATMLGGELPQTQILAKNLIADGFAGLLVRSFARGLGAERLNMVLWRWIGPNLQLDVIDDEDRLTRG